MCFAAHGCGQVEDEEQLSQRQDRQDTGIKVNADSSLFLTISLHTAIKLVERWDYTLNDKLFKKHLPCDFHFQSALMSSTNCQCEIG